LPVFILHLFHLVLLGKLLIDRSKKIQ